MSFNTPVSNEILSMITGKLLGDGCITKQKGRNPRFQFIHSATDKEWCFFCYKKLMNDLPLAPPHYKKVIDKRISKGFTECYQVQSRTDPLKSCFSVETTINEIATAFTTKSNS
jgi:hypothetical protein